MALPTLNQRQNRLTWIEKARGADAREHLEDMIKTINARNSEKAKANITLLKSILAQAK
jgi:hypothetical protein